MDLSSSRLQTFHLYQDRRWSRPRQLLQLDQGSLALSVVDQLVGTRDSKTRETARVARMGRIGLLSIRKAKAICQRQARAILLALITKTERAASSVTASQALSHHVVLDHSSLELAQEPHRA